MARPMELALRFGWHIFKNKIRGRKRFPLVTMLEPLEMCNLACEGCGRIREYESVIHRTMTADECLSAVAESGAPIVSIAGGEPTMHPQIGEIVNRITAQKKFAYMCTNGLLMERVMKQVKPSKYFCFVVHLDGMEEQHDKSVYRKGVFKVAMRAVQSALDKGYRVCSNTTIFKGSDIDDLHQLFGTLTDMGIEGCMVAPGFDYESVPNQDLFLTRKESHEYFKKVLDPSKNFRFYNNPLYLDFLRGNRDYQCTAWSNPTYTIMGWRKPCYLLATEGHTQDVNELMDGALWEKYGVGKDDRCANCMMHCGFESATIFGAMSNPKDFIPMIKGMAFNKSGIGAG